MADLTLLIEKSGPEYQLDSFDNRIAHVTPGYRPASPRPGLINKLPRFRRSSAPSIVKERGFWFDPRVLEANDGSTIEGYFQSWKYFHAETECLRQEIKSLHQPTDSFLKIKSRLASEEPWIGVHVRRGDYTKIPQMGITENYYYHRALEFVQNLTGVEAVRVFSDDITAASELPSLRGNSDVEFISLEPGSTPLENLLCLASAHHLIMANSSFSWWAAWLNERPSRIVTYPRPWVDFRAINDRDLPFPTWIGLGRENTEAAVNIHVGY